VRGGRASSGRIEVPAEWRAIVERALAKRPEDRFQDARAMLTAIRAIERVDAKPPRSAGES